MFRSVLFLQGVASPFFAALAERLESQGCRVYRINFCGGDVLFSGNHPDSRRCWDYRLPADVFSDWLANKLSQHRITDMVLFGDSRPAHQKALVLARARGLGIYVYEEGYCRPHCITLERGGVNAYSSLPRKPQWYRKQRGKFPTVTLQKTGYSLWVRAWHDIRYHLASFVLKQRFPHYSTHRPESPLTEYGGWARRFPTLPFHNWYGRRMMHRLIRRQTDYYLLPLQLSADTQIQVHSPFKHVSEVIERTLLSFARYAPEQTLLLIKNHPLDTGLYDYRKQIRQLQKIHGVEGRVIYLEDGYLPDMVRHARGVVLVNSTTGMSSLYHKVPTCLLGKAIYDMPGLTFQGGLDRFWAEGTPPEPELYRDFQNAVLYLTQVNGDFYSQKGIAMAVEGSLRFFGLEDVSRSALPLEAPMPATTYAYQRQIT